MCGVREGTLGLPASKSEGMGNEGVELRKTNVRPPEVLLGNVLIAFG